MKSIIAFLLEPYPAHNRPGRQLLLCLIVGITVFIALFYLKPFGVNLLNSDNQLKYALIYAIIASVVVFIFTIFFPFIFPEIYDEKRWTVCKEVISIGVLLVTIGAINVVAHHRLDGDPVNWKTFLKSISYILPIAAFPVT